MEDTNENNHIQQARATARKGAVKGERAAEEIAEEATEAKDDLKALGGRAAERMRSVGENAYEEISDYVADGREGVVSLVEELWSAASDAARNGWKSARVNVEKRPLLFVGIALATGIVLGGIIRSRK